MKFKKKNFLIVVSAPSGGGKSTINQAILNDCENIVYSISYTTRKPRGAEEHGKDYFFVSEEEFKDMIQRNEFLEYAKVHNFYYGTSRRFIEDKIKENYHVIMDIDVQGAEKIRQSNIDMISVFVIPPTNAELRYRLENRGTDSKEVIKTRLINAKTEIKEIPKYDYLIVNDDLDLAISELKSIIVAEENKVERYFDVEKTFYCKGDE